MNLSLQAGRLAERIARHPYRTLAIAGLVSVMAIWAVMRLPVYTSRQALLPKDTAVAQRMEGFLRKFGAASDLIVVVEGAPRAELEAFATELATRLRSEPEIGQATERFDTGFLLQHAYLPIPAERLDQLAALAQMLDGTKLPSDGEVLDEGLREALERIKAHPSPTDMSIGSAEESLAALNFLLEEWQRWLEEAPPPDGLDWNRLLARYGAEGLGNGYFASRDGGMLFLFVHPKKSVEEFGDLQPFVDKVKAVSAALGEQSRAAGRAAPSVAMTGLPAIEYEERSNIQADIALVIGSAIVLIALLILVVARSVRWALIIFVPMGLGVLWSLGLVLVTIGHLTIITASFMAILFGLGADYGIFTSSRIAEERRAGRPLVEAIGHGIGASFTAVLTAGGASVMIFGALATVEFPGFAELGLVAAKGVLLILVATWLVQPALYALLPPKLPAPPREGSVVAGPAGRGAFPRPVAITLVVLAVGAAAFGILRGMAIPFDYDVLSMLPADSQAARYQRRMVAESDFQAEVVIFTAQDMAEARRITAAAGKLPSIAKVQSLTPLFPEDAEARTRKVKNIAETIHRAGLTGRIAELGRTGLPAETFELLRAVLKEAGEFIDTSEEQAFSAGHSKLVEGLEKTRGLTEAIQARINQDVERGRARSELFLPALLASAGQGLGVIEGWRDATPLTPQRLPPNLRDRFFADDGSIAVYAFPAKSVYDPASLDTLIQEVYSVSPDATGFPTTHQAFAKSVVTSFVQGTVLAVLVCLLWIAAVVHNLRGIVLASLPLLIGGGWMLGLMALAGFDFNYANLVALPMVIALAVDYGVWFNYRWSELKDSTPLQVSLIAGRVIGLAAGTELAGLGGITLARYRGVSTMGVSITLGLLCCLIATLLVAPAIAQLLDPRRKS
jgi:predicted RND superfamily exporter protein